MRQAVGLRPHLSQPDSPKQEWDEPDSPVFAADGGGSCFQSPSEQNLTDARLEVSGLCSAEDGAWDLTPKTPREDGLHARRSKEDRQRHM